VETGSQVIIAHRVVRGPRREAWDALSLIKKTGTVHPVGYSMDKAYDSEGIRRMVHEEVRAACMIPLKKRAKSGTYRLAMREEFDEGLYHRRNLVETAFSVEKRVFGDVNHSKSDRLRNKESKLRNVCYNLYRYCRRVMLVVVRGFYRA
jgi:transposase